MSSGVQTRFVLAVLRKWLRTIQGFLANWRPTINVLLALWTRLDSLLKRRSSWRRLLWSDGDRYADAAHDERSTGKSPCSYPPGSQSLSICASRAPGLSPHTPHWWNNDEHQDFWSPPTSPPASHSVTDIPSRMATLSPYHDVRSTGWRSTPHIVTVPEPDTPAPAYEPFLRAPPSADAASSTHLSVPAVAITHAPDSPRSFRPRRLSAASGRSSFELTVPADYERPPRRSADSERSEISGALGPSRSPSRASAPVAVPPHPGPDQPYIVEPTPSLSYFEGPSRPGSAMSMTSLRDSDSTYVNPESQAITAVPAHWSGKEAKCTACTHDILRPYIRPITTDFIKRYERNVAVPSETTLEEIAPVTTTFSNEPLPDGWQAFTHPEGALYFFLRHKRVLTDANLHDEHVREHIERAIALIEDARADHTCAMPVDTELVLEFNEDIDSTPEVWYYFVDHKTRSLFWLNTYYPSAMLQEINGVTSVSHMKHEIEFHYWTHWEYFPMEREVPTELLYELISVLSYAGVDTMTSRVSTVPYNTAQLNDMVGFAKNIRSVGGKGGFSSCLFGRLMGTFAHHRFLNFHGQLGARLCINQSVHQKDTSPTWLITFLSPLLFCAPDVHLRNLEHIYVDQVISQLPWKKFIGRLQTEWEEFITIATILLTANVAFLAIPSVDQPFTQNPNPHHKTASQITSYISVLASVGSIIMSLLQVRQHRTKGRHTAEEAARYLSSRTHPKYGLETLAILYSLPYALLMWGMVAFLVSFAFMCFQGTNNPTRAAVGGTIFMIGSLLAWCVYTGWEINEWSWWTRITTLLRRQTKELQWPNVCPSLTGQAMTSGSRTDLQSA